VALDLIQCKEVHELVIRTTNSFPACIKTENVEKLREKGGAISEQEQEEIFAEIAFNRKKGIESSSVFDDFDVSITITLGEINNQRCLSFEGNGWRRLHDVEITITGEMFSESLLTKTDDNRDLSMS